MLDIPIQNVRETPPQECPDVRSQQQLLAKVLKPLYVQMGLNNYMFPYQDTSEPALDLDVPSNQAPNLWRISPKSFNQIVAGVVRRLAERDSSSAMAIGIPNSRAEAFSPTSSWEGFVTVIEDEFFFANVTKCGEEAGVPDIEMKFELADLTVCERESLEIGDIIFWQVGRELLGDGSTQRVSRVSVSRSPAPTKEDYDRALKEAEELIDGIHWE